MFPGAPPLPGAPYHERVVEVIVLVYLQDIRLLKGRGGGQKRW